MTLGAKLKAGGHNRHRPSKGLLQHGDHDMRRLAFLLMMLLCLPAQAEVIDFVAAGRGIDPDRMNRITSRLVYNPSTSDITHISRLSYQGVLGWEVGRMDVHQPYNGTYDGQTLAVTGSGGLDQYSGVCGDIAALSVSGDVRGELYFSLIYPDDVPGGCPLAGHMAEGRTTGSVVNESVPEPSGWVLMILGTMGVMRWRKR